MSKSEELYHFDLEGVEIFLFESFDEDLFAFLAFLGGFLLVEGVAAESQIAHDCVIDIEEVENGKDEHKDGEDVDDLRGDGDVSEEKLKLGALNGGQLEVIVAEGIADSGHVHRGKQQGGSCRVFLVHLKNPVNLHPENRVRYHVNYVSHQ